ncbi:hypothetical protein WJX84_003697 [Apatococcus fuscideae]|uniref:Uncharacterized protein n=1 Tax=Apatococcus fuscideae TaxID=2026836 RepID=A0AAW1SWU3_9CHLO
MQRALSSLLAWHLVLIWCAILPAEIGAQPAIGNCSIPGTVQFQASQDIPAQKAAVTTFFTSVNVLPAPPDAPLATLVQLALQVREDLETLLLDGNCSAALDYSILITEPAPWTLPGVSYCTWIGIQCCISGGGALRKPLPSTSPGLA